MSDSKSCCEDGSEHHHQEHHHPPASVQPTKAWFCPMCPGVESDEPGACPKCGMALERNPAFTNRTAVLYTCPMHPEVRQDHPGVCPICGMALEPVQATLQDENGELRSMVLRFKVGLILGLPVLVLAMGAHFFSLDAIPPRVSAWIQFIVSTPVVLWCGWPFFERGARSVVARNLNMFTLIALGTGHCLHLQRFRAAFSRIAAAQLYARWRAASFISKQPLSSLCSCSSDRCWNCGPAPGQERAIRALLGLAPNGVASSGPGMVGK